MTGNMLAGLLALFHFRFFMKLELCLNRVRDTAMGGKTSGRAWLEEAKACLAKAKTVEELRPAQAVVLPLEFGLSLERTARAIGVAVGGERT